jgi:hypothetical protein
MEKTTSKIQELIFQHFKVQYTNFVKLIQNLTPKYIFLKWSKSLLKTLLYVNIQFVTTCDYLSFVTMFYHFYN